MHHIFDKINLQSIASDSMFLSTNTVHVQNFYVYDYSIIQQTLHKKRIVLTVKLDD